MGRPAARSLAQVPCTPAGCVELLQRSGVEVGGKTAVVIGRRGDGTRTTEQLEWGVSIFSVVLKGD